MKGKFMGFGGIADRDLLRSGAEALAIGFPLDGPVRDATLLALTLSRHAEDVETQPEYLEYLAAVEKRYPTQYAELARRFSEQLTARSVEIAEIPPLLLAAQAGA